MSGSRRDSLSTNVICFDATAHASGSLPAFAIDIVIELDKVLAILTARHPLLGS